MTDEGLARVGWSTAAASLDLGTDRQGWGYGGTGKKSHNRQFDGCGLRPVPTASLQACLQHLNDYRLVPKHVMHCSPAFTTALAAVRVAGHCEGW